MAHVFYPKAAFHSLYLSQVVRVMTITDKQTNVKLITVRMTDSPYSLSIGMY